MTASPQLGAILERLAPPGRAWPRGVATTARAVLEGLAGPMAEIERRAAQLLVELDPRTAAELLPDFERVLGLPDPCTGGEPQTIAERRVWVVQRLTASAGATAAEIIRLALVLGVVVTVEEFHAFVAGSFAGETLSGGDWLHTVRIHAPHATGTFFRVGTSGAGDRLFSSARDQLACLLEATVPAHVVPLVVFDVPADPSYQPWAPAIWSPTPAVATPSPSLPTIEG